MAHHFFFNRQQFIYIYIYKILLVNSEIKKNVFIIVFVKLKILKLELRKLNILCRKQFKIYNIFFYPVNVSTNLKQKLMSIIFFLIN